MPALQLLIGNTRLLFGFGFKAVPADRPLGGGDNGFVNGCARPVDVAAGDAGSNLGRVEVKVRAKLNSGRRDEARRRQRVQIIDVVSVNVEGVDGLVLDIFWTLYGSREVPFARSISSSFS